MKDNLLSRIDNHIILDQIVSWPYEILQVIRENEEIIHTYLQLEDQIDKQAEENVLLRIYRPRNQYESEWLDIINQLGENLKVNKFVGFHCTKLVDIEIDNILNYGLKPLNSEMLDFRINQLYYNKVITNKVAEELKKNNLSSESNRNGKVFFFHCSKTLKDQGGLYRLFRAWGGEALYANHERNSKISDKIFGIGKPCIVLGSLSYDSINPYPSLAARFISVFLSQNYPEYYSYDFDNWVQKPVKALSIITIEEELFEQLTKFSTWKLDR